MFDPFISWGDSEKVKWYWGSTYDINESVRWGKAIKTIQVENAHAVNGNVYVAIVYVSVILF